MVAASASRSRLVPYHLLVGASCLWPNSPAAWLPPSPHRADPLPKSVLRTLPGRPPAEGAATAGSVDLTPAEERVCELVLQGLSNKEIASVLGRAEPTIKNQVASILRKHGVPSRARLIAFFG